MVVEKSCSCLKTPNGSGFLTKRIWNEIQEYPKNIDFKREEFQHDRDRIIHSRAFRRLMHKTQVFQVNKGDHFRNRLTHSLEVCQIARSIGKNIGLNDELIEAIALGHDLGHTPFGHVGERTLNTLLFCENNSKEDNDTEMFKHNFQSLRVIDFFESRSDDYNGLNLTFAVREGILKHTKINKDLRKNYELCGINFEGINFDNPFSCTLEGQTVAVADEIAQCTHDLEDSVRGGIISLKDLSVLQIVPNIPNNIFEENKRDDGYYVRTQIISKLIHDMILDVSYNSKRECENYINKFGRPSFSCMEDCIRAKCVWFSAAEYGLFKELQDCEKRNLLCSEEISKQDAKGEYIIKKLFKAYIKHPMELPDNILMKLCEDKKNYNRKDVLDNLKQKEQVFLKRIVADHIAGMTDQYLQREYNRMYLPEYI